MGKLTVLISLAILYGCTHSYPEFGWYSYYEKEPAHMKPYERFGKTYIPIKPEDAITYRERGIASWYGSDFHGLPTSTGEIYDMYDYTAAHKTLPLGLYVKVRNLKNGKTSIVRLNDRGPFVEGRIIDLSYAAARELDFVDEGTTPVEIEALGFPIYEGQKITFQKPANYNVDVYRVQIASFKIKENAIKLAMDFQKKSIEAKITEFRKKDELFYRVRVGKFKNIEDAEKFKDKMKKEGFNQSFVVGD